MTSKRRQEEDSKTNAVSFRLRDVTICMERTSQPEGVRFTIEREAGANPAYQRIVAGGRIMRTENGITLYLDWSGAAIASEMVKRMGGSGYAEIAIELPTSKSAGAR